MPKRASLSERVAQSTAEKVEETKAKSTELGKKKKDYLPPSRQGKKVVSVYIPPTNMRDLKVLAADEDTNVHALGLEALNMLLTSRGLPLIELDE
ncbi:ribbon-helix-helix domain-containing protein [Acaryochloris marina]|uniref:ribbon-helix-helix domain-containing protein n=1 Tax=Acaryochloris marina TaxID=155978 RepID=UPI0021C34359|nr:ribbon-helix-helix domain-containing protein [Acaryochloris marina]BDM83811.1 hypothetical protein AM10699_66720 [Acaryochloris marina MBIC10699]